MPYRARVTEGAFRGRLPGGRGKQKLPSLLVDLAAGREPGAFEIENDLVRLANEHGLTGLLWDWARSHVDEEKLKTELAQNDLYVQAHLVRLWEVLEESVMRFSSAGIEVATIKGVTTEARWYRRRGARPCADVDLLLSPRDLHRAGQAVRLIHPDHAWAFQVDTLVAEGRVQTVTTRLDGVEVDLHFDLFKLGVPTRQREAVWDRTEQYSMPSGASVRVLDTTTALVHFLVHLNKDRFQRLLGCADVARILDSGEVDWLAATHLAEGEGIEAMVFRSLEVVLGELSLPWPEALERPRGLRVKAWNLIWRPGIRLRGAEGRLRFRRRQDWYALLARGRALEAMRWWVREMWPPSAIVDIRYSGVRGPYLWKLMRGRYLTARETRGALASRNIRSGPPAGGG